MKIESEHKAELSFEIPDGVHIESRRELRDSGKKDASKEPSRNMLHIWSRSDVSQEDAVLKIDRVGLQLEEALEEK